MLREGGKLAAMLQKPTRRVHDTAPDDLVGTYHRPHSPERTACPSTPATMVGALGTVVLLVLLLNWTIVPEAVGIGSVNVYALVTIAAAYCPLCVGTCLIPPMQIHANPLGIVLS